MISGVTQNQMTLFQIVPLDDISYAAYRPFNGEICHFRKGVP
jgi:hypothetical protein